MINSVIVCLFLLHLELSYLLLMRQPLSVRPRRRLSLRLIPVKALSYRRQAQTLWRERRRAPGRVCASLPSKPYPTVGRRKLFDEKGAVGPPEFAPPPRQSLILPPAGANCPAPPLLFFISSCNYHTVVYNDKCVLALK